MENKIQIKSIIQKFFTFLLIFIGLTSCQKVINIDLNSVSPEIVIEGNITDKPGPYVVYVSQTVNFSDANEFPPVTGAIVTITDNTGSTELLSESKPGEYITSTTHGTPGKTYTLSVTAKGKTYTASSSMANPVSIDSLVNKAEGFGNENSWYARVIDPAGIDNYYALFVSVNNVVQSNFSTSDDKQRDGDTIDFRIPIPRDVKLEPGDSVNVILESIDKNVREYFRLLRQLNRSGIQSAPPANPVNNITGGALGYFSAHSDRKKLLIIP